MVVRWTFEDEPLTETYTFAFNPSESNTPGVKKNITSQATTAPDGVTVLFEGEDAVERINISGSILYEDQLAAYLYWWGTKRNQIQVTDDLGRTFWVVLEDFTPKRRRSTSHPWAHTFDASMIVVQAPGT